MSKIRIYEQAPLCKVYLGDNKTIAWQSLAQRKMNLPAASHGVSQPDTALRGGAQIKETPQAAEYCTPVHTESIA